MSWRVAFFGEAILMLPFAVLGFVMKPLQMKGVCSVSYMLFLSPFFHCQIFLTFFVTGFASTGSRKSLESTETAFTEVEGTQCISLVTGINNCFLLFFFSHLSRMIKRGLIRCYNTLLINLFFICMKSTIITLNASKTE